MPIIDPPAADSIMAIAAHPDDIESWCAGTFACAGDRGATVCLLLVTSGENGTDDPSADPAHVGCQREAEARAAAAELGIAEVALLREPDSDIQETRTLRGQVVSWIRRWRPAVIFTHDPEHDVPAYFLHHDHRITGRVTLNAVYPLARDPSSFPEQLAQGLAPHIVPEVWLFASAVADSYVDITDSFERNVRARLAHQSQTSDADALRQAWQRRAAAIGAAAGLKLAEAFWVLNHY